MLLLLQLPVPVMVVVEVDAVGVVVIIVAAVLCRHYCHFRCCGYCFMLLLWLCVFSPRQLNSCNDNNDIRRSNTTSKIGGSRSNSKDSSNSKQKQ